MKKSSTIYILIIFLGFQNICVFSQKPSFNSIIETKNIKNLIIFNNKCQIKGDQLFTLYSNDLGLSNDDEMKLFKVQHDALGFIHYKYQQIYKGIEIEGAVFIVHEKNGIISKANGNLAADLSFNISPSIQPNKAFKIALDSINTTTYMWEDATLERELKTIKNDLNATYYPKHELVIKQKESGSDFSRNNLYLAYRYTIYTKNPFGCYIVYVDAITGILIKKISAGNDVVGSGCTRYNGTQNINTTYSSPNGYYLYDGIVRTKFYCGGNPEIPIWDSNNNWICSEFTPSCAKPIDVVVSPHWAAERTFDYYNTVYGLNSYDGQGTEMLQKVNLAYKASWYPNGIAYFGPAQPPDANDWFVSLDCVAHEWTHGISYTSIGFSAEPDQYSEIAALCESFSDIMGTMVEFYAEGANGDWLVGEDFWDPNHDGYLRNMSDPNLKPQQPGWEQSDTYLGTYWNNYYGDCHFRCGVQNYWFYLLSEGGSGINDNGYVYNITGIGKNSAAKIAFRTFTNYITPSSEYANARTYSIQAAIDLYGDCSNEVIQTIQAWNAVGLTGVCSCPHDLYIKDIPSDIGIEPDPGDYWNLVDGIDVWVRNSQDNLISGYSTPHYAHEFQHESPEWKPDWASFNSLPYIYAKVRNRGCTTVSGYLKLYYHKIATNDLWDADNGSGLCGSWQELLCDDTNGNEITDNNESNHCTSNVITLAPGEEWVVEQPWYVASQFPDPGISGNRNEYCLLARFLSPDDPMTNEVVGVHAAINAKNNNNIVQKNVIIVSNKKGTNFTYTVDFGNASGKTTVNKINFVDVTPIPFSGTNGLVTIDLGEPLYRAWVNGGKIGTGISNKIDPLNPYVIELTNITSSIENITLKPFETYPINVKFNYFPGDSSIIPFEYQFRQYESFNTIDPKYNFTGAVKFYINKPNCPNVFANSDTIICVGQNANLTGSPVVENATYEWSDVITGQLVDKGTSIIVSPSISTTYNLKMSSPDGCICNDVVKVTVNPLLPVSVSISASANLYCARTLVTFTAIPVNGGTAPNYQWRVNGMNVGSDTPTFRYSPSNKDVVTCIMTSSELCVIGNPTTSNAMTIKRKWFFWLKIKNERSSG